MGKKKAYMAGALAITLAALIVFETLRPFLIGVGFVGLLWLIASEASNRSEQKAQAQRDAFDSMALLVLRGELDGSDMRKLLAVAHQLGFQRQSLIARLKQFRESADLALSSKKKDVAESRMHYATDAAHDIVVNHQHTVSPHVLDELRAVLIATQTEFHTRLYLNLARPHMDKADTLKTSKGKRKHLELAMQAIQEGVAAGKGDMVRLQGALHSVTTMRDSLD